MARNFTPDSERECIGLSEATRRDILPWMASAGLVLLIFLGVQKLVGSTHSSIDDLEASAALYSAAAPLYYILTVVGVLLARRSRDIWTWLVSGVLIIFFTYQGSISLSTVWMPNGILYTMIAMLGLLATGKIIRYLLMRTDTDEPRLTLAALSSYFIILVCSVLANSPFFYDLLNK